MSFIDITNTDIQALIKSGVRLWVVDKLPPNTDNKQDLLTAVVGEGDSFYEVIAKWLKQAGIEAHRDNDKREKQLIELMKDNAVPKNNLALVLENTEKLHKQNYSLFKVLTETCDCTVIIQGNILLMGSDILKKDDFINKACIGVHVTKIN